MPTPTLPPISENGEGHRKKTRKISASDKETATDSNQNNLLCPSKETTETEQAHTKQNKTNPRQQQRRSRQAQNKTSSGSLSLENL
jgi:hypothetical protein